MHFTAQFQLGTKLESDSKLRICDDNGRLLAPCKIIVKLFKDMDRTSLVFEIPIKRFLQIQPGRLGFTRGLVEAVDCVFSAEVRKSEGVALGGPVMPVFDGLGG